MKHNQKQSAHIFRIEYIYTTTNIHVIGTLKIFKNEEENGLIIKNITSSKYLPYGRTCPDI